MKTILLSMFAVFAGLLALGCNGPTVVQGSVMSYDQTAKSIVVKDETTPNPEMTISAANADIGAEPRPGDVVRVAYRDEGGFLRATKVMNVTRQEERKQTQGGH
jgi:hypothetical protein